MGEPAGAEHGERASSSSALGVGALVGPELQGHRDHLRPALALAQRGDRGVDAAAERDQHPLAGGRRRGELPARAGEPGERAVQRVGGELGRVRALRADARRALRRSRRGRSSAASSTEAPSASSAAAAAAARAVAQPSASKLVRAIRAVARPRARSGPGRRRARRRRRRRSRRRAARPAAAAIGEVVLECLGVHALGVGARGDRRGIA